MGATPPVTRMLRLFLALGCAEHAQRNRVENLTLRLTGRRPSSSTRAPLTCLICISHVSWNSQTLDSSRLPGKTCSLRSTSGPWTWPPAMAPDQTCHVSTDPQKETVQVLGLPLGGGTHTGPRRVSRGLLGRGTGQRGQLPAWAAAEVVVAAV